MKPLVWALALVAALSAPASAASSLMVKTDLSAQRMEVDVNGFLPDIRIFPAAVHGTDVVRLSGTPASHGYVRPHPTSAAKPYSLVRQYGMSGTKIVVTR